ncbi:hypothetical protein NM208_g10792 [Fusarium decemcellulare]|uniref:Uncharacterized protein n=1 Tax=Fusarium decemcellulare TaxID=57161 RepID=A0ACC1RX20_9HYPO|nr:hypothetical protein NM208_g10792 [Fusarium decemcellulare]
MESAQKSNPQAKRTRTNVKQSKFGCFTCKKRRIKCDEAKPSCQRCLSYNLSCDGYPRGAPPGSLFERTPSSHLSQNPSHPRSRYAHLACIVFSQGPRRAKSEIEVAFWNRIVPQLIHSTPAVRAAAAAFGASYEEHMLRPSRACLGLRTAQQYSRALQLVQLEVSSVRHNSLPCIVACLLMAFAEVIQQRSDRAYLHLQGASALMAARDEEARASIDDEGISALFEKLNLHSATYLMTRSPDLPCLYSAPYSASLSPDQSLYKMLHGCYRFISTAWQYKYVNPLLIPSYLFIEQARHLGNLRHWLSCHQLDPSRPIADSQNEQLLVLRAQCLAGMIYSANALASHETCYDGYELEFQQIIESGQALLEIQQADNSLSSSGGLSYFTPEMGIIQPLFLTALKYRHSFWRRKALDLLLKSGREGPWCGAIEARILQVVIEAEERILSDLPSEKFGPHQPSVITESQRVHLCWVVGYVDQDDNIIVAGGGGVARAHSAKVQLCKCHDVDELLSSGKRGPSMSFWQDQAHWHTWLETVSLPE